MNTNDIHQSPPFPLIHVDLNRDPNPSPDFFFPVHHDQDHYPHPANSVDELIIARGGRHCHPPSYVIEGDRRIGDCDNENGHDLARDPHHHHEYCSVKWMSSKMRIMKKMTTGGGVGKPSAARKFDPDIKRKAVPAAILENDDSSNNSNRSSISGGIEINNSNKNQPIIIRVCSDCNTTKTPLWRSGPRGPKSLCNACGIRQRKARRAMALAAAAANGEPPPYTIPDLAQKAANKKEKKRSSSSENKDDEEDESDLQPKKKRKRKGNKIIVNPPADPREICFEEFRLRLSDRISGVQGMFPQDEKEAAILLMALSYGLVQS